MNIKEKRVYSDKEYKYMDHIVNITCINLVSLSKDFEGIQLYSFDFLNKEHLYLLEVAYIFRRLYNKEICIAGNFFNTVKWNWKKRKKEDKIYTSNEHKLNYKIITVNTFLDFMRPVLNESLKGFTYADIYEAYYE